MSVQHVYEITVIGGGPVGMFAAFMPRLRQARCLIIKVLMNSVVKPEIYIRPRFFMISAASLMSAVRILVAQLKTQLMHF